MLYNAMFYFLVFNDVCGTLQNIITENSVDNYQQLTFPEYYPDVCNNYSNENCAKLWLSEINNFKIRNGNRGSNVKYKYSTDITDENLQLKQSFDKMLVKINQAFNDKVAQFQWRSFTDPDLRRIFKKLSMTIQSKNLSVSKEIIEVGNKISQIYNKGQACFSKCIELGEAGIVKLFQNERDYEKLAGFWTSWHNVTGDRIRDLFIKRRDLENIGARENGYTDAVYFSLVEDFEEKNFKDVVNNLYEEILPFYKKLHAYVRYCLARYYPGRFDENGPIPAHILGNIWGQQWVNIFHIIKKCPDIKQNNDFQQDVNKNIMKLSAKAMFEKSEEFFKSIGMYKMTDTFWNRSVIEPQTNKIIDCHGSAYDFSNGEDYRIIMCTKKNVNDFTTIHHEMGHIEYYMAYKNLPFYYRESANSGFHEAVGDTIGLAVKTPKHLHSIGLISHIPNPDDFDIDYLMISALEKVVFLPFALTMDSYVWSVYNGSVPTSDLNKHWWYLRYKYQGLKPPVKRSENNFDAGAKYHIAFGISYIRYFVSFILQFQFYDSMCKLSGYEGPLHRCDFYKSKQAGSKMLEMLKQGRKNHWRETLQILTGKKNIQIKSILKFFEPLNKWLDNQIGILNITVGW